MWRWQLTPTSGIRWFWEPIGPLLKFYWEFCVRMPPGEKKSRAGRRPCARGRLSRGSLRRHRGIGTRSRGWSSWSVMISPWSSLRTSPWEMRLSRSVPLTAGLSSPHGPLPILFWKIGCIEWPRTLNQSKIQPSCWYPKAVGKCFSRRLIAILWPGTWGRRQH